MEGRGLPSGRSDYFQTDDWDTVAFKWAAGVKRIPYDFNKRDTYIYYLSACAYPQGTVCSRRTGCILKPDLRYLRIPGKGEDAGGKLLLYRWAGQESRVSAVRPGIRMDMLVYVDLWKCPEGFAPEPCLQIDEAAWGKEQRTCGRPDGDCLSYTEFESNLMEWKRAFSGKNDFPGNQAGASVVYYDYYMGVYGNRQRIIPMADEIQSIWKRFAELDIAGAGTQIECFNLWNHLVNLYTFGRTAYDVSLSLEANLNALCRLFGEGGEWIVRAVLLMEEALDGESIIGFAGKYMIEHVDKERIYGLFDRALSAAAGETQRNNIRLLRMAFRYSEIETADSANRERKTFSRFQEYDDPSGELAYMAVHFDSFRHNDPGYGIAFPVTNTDTKDFVPDAWYAFEG